ncbi:MAG: hypothetical protein WDN28_22480 [Chthoniobacter sp.]
MPTRYTLRQPLTQWTPYLQRRLSFAPSAAGPRLRWEAMRAGPPVAWTGRQANEDVLSEKFVAEKIEAKGWIVHVFRPRFPTPEHASFVERLSIAGRPWVTARSPSGEMDLLDLPLDHGPDDMLVVPSDG